MATPEETIGVVHEVYGTHVGYRALHAKGKLLTGTFTATADADRLTRAAHLQGSPVPALVRFSNGAGNPHHPDNTQDVRGMAVKLTLPDGSRTDISAQTAGLFTSQDVDSFNAFMLASKKRPSMLWRVPWYAVTHPGFLRGLPANHQIVRVPASFASARYHGLHAFKWLDGDGGERFVRYTWVPEGGTKFLGPLAAARKDRNFLFAELDERLARGPVRFQLQVQVAGPGDSTTDSTRRWRSKQTVVVGTLEVTGVDTEREKDGDVVVFDPMRLTDGIEASDDPILRFRTHAYSVSVRERTGVPRGPEAPAVP